MLFVRRNQLQHIKLKHGPYDYNPIERETYFFIFYYTCTAVCELMQPLAGGFDITTTHPRTASYIERVKNKTEPYFTEVHETLEIVKDRIQHGICGPEIHPHWS